MAKGQGMSLTGPDGLLKQLNKTVIDTALDEEMTKHLGYEKHDAAGKQTANSRNGVRPKTVLTETTCPWRSTCRGTGKARSKRLS